MDASHEAVEAVLSRVQDGRERVIAFFSKILSRPEQICCVTRKELLAIVKAVKYFLPYLYGRRFTICIAHILLQWLCRCQEHSSQVTRWLEILSDFRFTIQHPAGRQHGNANGFSRQLCEECPQCERRTKRDSDPT